MLTTVTSGRADRERNTLSMARMIRSRRYAQGVPTVGRPCYSTSHGPPPLPVSAERAVSARSCQRLIRGVLAYFSSQLANYSSWEMHESVIVINHEWSSHLSRNMALGQANSAR